MQRFRWERSPAFRASRVLFLVNSSHSVDRFTYIYIWLSRGSSLSYNYVNIFRIDLSACDACVYLHTLISSSRNDEIATRSSLYSLPRFALSSIVWWSARLIKRLRLRLRALPSSHDRMRQRLRPVLSQLPFERCLKHTHQPLHVGNYFFSCCRLLSNKRSTTCTTTTIGRQINQQRNKKQTNPNKAPRSLKYAAPHERSRESRR